MGNLGAWKSVLIRTVGREVTWAFGHDFRNRELWIIEVGSGRRIARIASGLTTQETEEIGRVVRQAPVLNDACREAVRRLAKARHPNAISLRELIFGALRGMDRPLIDEVSDRIDP